MLATNPMEGVPDEFTITIANSCPAVMLADDVNVHVFHTLSSAFATTTVPLVLVPHNVPEGRPLVTVSILSSSVEPVVTVAVKNATSVMVSADGACPTHASLSVALSKVRVDDPVPIETLARGMDHAEGHSVCGVVCIVIM